MNEWRIPQPKFNADIRHVTVSTDDPEIGRAILMAYGEKLGANGMKSEGNLIAQLRAYPAHYTAAHEAADEIERLRAALEPFALFTDAHDMKMPARAGLHMRHFRRARELVSPSAEARAALAEPKSTKED